MRRELYLIHEFIADEEAVADKDASAFASMLLRAQYGKLIFSPAQSFFYSPVKRRLIMLTTSKKPRFSYARRIITLPLLASVVLLFAFRLQRQDRDMQMQNRQFINDTTPGHLKGIKIVDVGLPNSQKVADTTVPESIRIVDVALVDTTQPKNLGRYQDKAVIHVEADFKKGIATLTLEDKTKKQISIEEARKSGILLPPPPPPPPPIVTIVEDESKIKNDAISMGNVTLSVSDSVLYLINGKVVTAKEVSMITPDEISSMNVLKDKSATDKYGAKGKNGVIEIITKKNARKILK
jgi:TonB-dependent SusC/RagA subfamily outer membrane receptor